MPLLNSIKANREKFDSKFGELRTPGGCVSSGMAFWKGHREIGKFIISIHKKGDRSEWTNYHDISLLSLPVGVHAMIPRK